MPRLPVLAAICAVAALLVAAPSHAATPVTGETIVTTASGLKNAVAAAKPGAVITLAKGTYTVSGLTLAANGTSAKPITLRGSGAVITTGSTSTGYGIHVTGDYWVIRSVTVTKALKGIMADGASHLAIDGVMVSSIGHEAIHLRAGSANGVIRNSTIRGTGMVEKGYGEGIYIGSAQSNWKSVMGSSSTPDRSDYALIENNTISSTPAEGIDIKEGTTGGTVRGNVFTNAGTSGANSADSWVDVKGNKYVVSGNTGAGAKLDAFQTHVQLAGWGRWNAFSANTVTAGVPGYTVRVDPQSTPTTVKCSALRSGAQGLANVACVP